MRNVRRPPLYEPGSCCSRRRGLSCRRSLTLTEYCERVLLVHRRDELRAQKSLVDRVTENTKIEMFGTLL
ncbi:MAG: hypothetical protein Ct9H300mP11_29580 [Chloroflexota bacterium]|nr:MAG: hypothetical protein Ct9H300mP11_29580 [Chloroflexota bacterium]